MQRRLLSCTEKLTEKVSVSQLHWKLCRESFGFSVAVITYRAAPKPPKREKCFFPLGSPFAFSTSASARWLCFISRSDSRKIPPLRGSLRSGYNPRKKDARFSTSPQAIFWNRPQAFTSQPHLLHSLKSRGRFRKLAERSGLETRGSSTEWRNRKAARFPACRRATWNIASERSAQ